MDNIFRFIDFDFKHRWQSIFWNVVTLSVLGMILLRIGEVIRTWEPNLKFIIESPEPIRVAAFFLWLLLSFGILKLSWKNYQDDKLLIKDEVYNFKSSHWPSKWIFNGKTGITAKVDELFVNSSRAGCLLKTHIWKNFRMTFEMKFEDNYEKHLGIVFRAEDLDNYIMLEIFEQSPHKDGNSGLAPHIRYRGAWEIVHYEKRDNFNFPNFRKIVLEAKDDNVNLFYEDELAFTWTIPTHVDVNHIEAGIKQKENDKQIETLGKEVAKGVEEIPFRLAYGMVGFRAHPRQGANIRKLKVETL